MTLDELTAGQSAVVVSVGGAGALRQHFLDMGVIPGARVNIVQFAPMGDPMELTIHGYELTLRLADAARIQIRGLTEAERNGDEALAPSRKEPEHPGLGEGGRYHVTTGEQPLPDGATLTFALAGNQNSGKTTLFNRLTGANQHVGNFPGVTVDRKDGVIIGHRNTLITDLPGIYSMSPYSSEERNFVLDEKPDAIINIVDATNIDRNLYLTMPLLEMERPVVVALNMMDELTGNHGSVDINLMEKLLGVPVVPISAARNQGVDELIKHALSVAKYQTVPEKQDFCPEEDHGGALHRCIHSVSYLIEDHAARAGLSPAAAGSMLVFSLLYTPCVAAIASIRRELGSRWAASVVLWQCVVAWIAAFGFHAIAGLFG